MGTVAREARALERLRGVRVRAGGAAAVGGLVRVLAKQAGERHRALGGAVVGLMAALPEGLAQRVVPRGISRGMLVVEVEDSSARYELDRWLRGGGNVALMERSGGRVKGVKVK